MNVSWVADPFAPDAPSSRLVLGQTDGYPLPEDIREVVLDSRGNHVATLLHDQQWKPLRRHDERVVTGAVWCGADGTVVSAVVKKLVLEPDKSEPLLRFQGEVNAYFGSRFAHPANASHSEDVNRQLDLEGHPGRLPEFLAWWVDPPNAGEPQPIDMRRAGRPQAPIGLRPQAAIALTRLDGVPLQRLIERHPDGLPVGTASAIIVSLCRFVAAAHAVGVRLGDISVNNVLVCGDPDVPDTLYVNLVDLELADTLSAPDPEVRAVWSEHVLPEFRWRLHSPPVNRLFGFTGRELTFFQRRRELCLESDLGFVGVVARSALTGGSKGVADFSDAVPEPLRWIVRDIDRTGDLRERIRDGLAPEVGSARRLAKWFRILTPLPDESNVEYVDRVEAACDPGQYGLLHTLVEWAASSEDVALRATGVRVAATSLAKASSHLDPLRWLRTAAGMVSRISDDLSNDDKFTGVVDAAGLAPTGGDHRNCLLATIASVLSSGVDASVLERLNRLWPGIAPHFDSPRAMPSAEPQHFLSSQWLDQLVAHAVEQASPGVTPGIYSILVTDGRDASFSYTVDADGRLATVTRGTTLRAQATATVTTGVLADHLQGVAWFPRSPRKRSLMALWTLARVAPDPSTLSLITDRASWPVRVPGEAALARLGTAGWLSALVAHSMHRPTVGSLPTGHWSIVVVDAPSSSFTFEISPDRRLVGAARGVTAVPRRTTAIRRSRLVELLRERPKQPARDAVSVLCAAAGKIEPFTDPSPAPAEFLTAQWLTEFLCESRPTSDRALSNSRVVVVPTEDPSSSFELSTSGGDLVTVRPVDRLETGDATVVPAPLLWDAAVEGVLPDPSEGPVPIALRLLAATRPLDCGDFTLPAPRLGVPPGYAARVATAREAARTARHRAARNATQRRALAAIVTSLDQRRESLVTQTKHEAELRRAAIEVDAQARLHDMLEDVVVTRDQMLARTLASIDAFVDGVAEQYRN